MADWRTFFGLDAGCTDKCGDNVGPAPDNACNSFATDADGSDKEPGVVQLTCEDILKGFHCKTVNFLGKLNAWIKGLLCWLSNHETRISQLENENPVVNWVSNDNDGDGVYDITVTFKDGTTAVHQIEDTDTRLTNPRPQDTDNNGINDRVLWDVVDDDGNVVGSEIVPIQEYVDTNVFLQRINNITSGTVNLAFGGTYPFRMNNGVTWNLRMPAAPSSGGIELVSSPRLIEYFSTSSALDVTRNVNLNTISGVTVPAGAKGVIVRAKLSVSGPPTNLNCFAWIYVNGIEVSYADMNVNDGDNDNTNDALVRDTTLPTISYRFRQTLPSGGSNFQITQYWIYIVGFIL